MEIFYLNKDNNIQGFSFEFVGKIHLRRLKKNNFIFRTREFSNIFEILSKYHLKYSLSLEPLIYFLNSNWYRTDIIEFVLDDVTKRNVLKIEIYEVKSQNYYSMKEYIKLYHKVDDFFKTLIKKYDVSPKILSFTLFRNWGYSFDLKDYTKFKIQKDYT